MRHFAHIIARSAHMNEIIRNSKDFKEFANYLVLYKKRFTVSVVAYSYDNRLLHLLLLYRDQLRLFLSGVFDAYSYYYKDKYEKTLELAYRTYSVYNQDLLLHCLQVIHQLPNSSLSCYKDYSKYSTHPLLDMNLVVNTLADHYTVEEMVEAFVQEPVSSYALRIERDILLYNNKLDKRRSRAEDFLHDYLEEIQKSKAEVLNNKNDLEELVRRFRVETDLSYRDIGYVLGLSHTSIIRIFHRIIR